MKILVTETFQHFMPVGAGWIEGLEELGHTVFGLQSHLFSILDVDESLDVVVFMGMGTVKKDCVVKFKDRWPDTKLVVVCFGFEESYLELKSHIDLWVEHTYKHDLVDELFESAGMNLIHLPLAASSKLFYPTTNDNFLYDASFIGQFGTNAHGYREQDHYLYPIMQLPIKGFWSGFDGYQTIPAHELVRVYNSTKINLNFHYPYQKRQSDLQNDCIDFNSRVFDIALTGNFQLCDHPFVSEYFGEGIVYSTREDWRDIFQYFLVNEEERRSLASIARQTALTQHTWKSRMSTLTKLL